MKTKKNDTITMAIWIVLVLAGATGLGYGIRHVRWSLAMRRNLPESTSQTPEADSEPDVEIVQEPEPDIEIETTEVETVVVEEPVWEEPEEELPPEDAAEPPRQPWQPGRNWGAVRQFFADLNLNAEEQARLREGLALMRQRFESMSDEDQQVEMMRMAEIGWRWSNMTDQEREEVTQRMRERYEQWRRSDSIELPEFTLD
jgi:hypothetical protein